MAHRSTPRLAAHPTAVTMNAPSILNSLKVMTSQCSRSADQLASTINGEAWYGDSLREILAGVTAERARARPVPDGHSIWEIVAHLTAWINFYAGAIQGVP